jgi:hypothetical protein
MKSITIWSEGYQATGQSSDATCHGSFRAESFDAACEQMKLRVSQGHLMKKGTDGTWRYWGCRLFDNEAAARKGFG